MRAERLRLSIFTAATFAVLGAWIPFWPKWLEARGLGAIEIGQLAAIWALARGVTNPLGAHLVDVTGRRRPWILGLALAATALFLLFPACHDFAAYALLTFVVAGLQAPVMMLGENLVVVRAHEGGFSYGKVRLWGSVAFLVVSVATGLVIDDGHDSRVWGVVLAGLAASAVFAVFLPEARAVGRAASRTLPLRAVLGRRSLLAALAGGGILQASHATYYTFSALHWTEAGHTTTTVGALWAEGVLAETLLFAWASTLVRRLGSTRLMVLALVGGALRWLALASSTHLWVLVGTQWLHALTFAATHLAVMGFIAASVRREQSATAHSVYVAINVAAHVVTVSAVTPLFEASRGAAYLPMIAISVLGGATAAWGMRSAHRPAPQD